MLPDARNALADIPDDIAPYAESIFERWGGVLPFLDADPRAANMVEITTGLIARTSAGWTLLLRDIPNWWDLSDYQVLDGIVETDWFPSMVPTIIRLPEQGRAVRFHRDQPLAAIQPIPRVAFESATLSAAVVHQGLREFPTEVWRAWAEYEEAKRDRAGHYQRVQRHHRRVRQGGRGTAPEGTAPEGIRPEGAG